MAEQTKYYFCVRPLGLTPVATWTSGSVSATTLKAGDPLGEFVTNGSGGLNCPGGVEFGPDGHLYVSSFYTQEVLKYNGTTGAFLSAFVSASSGGLSNPWGLLFRNGSLLVAGTASDAVHKYNQTTGAYESNLVASGSGGLDIPAYFTFGPDGHLYVTSAGTHEIKKYNGSDGTSLGVFASGSGLNTPRDVKFGPDGNLYVSSASSNQILRYNGSTGAFIDSFATGGSMNFPVWIGFEPYYGRLLVVSYLGGFVEEYNPTTGAFVRTLIANGSGSFGANAEGIAFGADGNIYIGMCHNSLGHRIYKFVGLWCWTN